MLTLWANKVACLSSPSERGSERNGWGDFVTTETAKKLNCWASIYNLQSLVPPAPRPPRNVRRRLLLHIRSPAQLNVNNALESHILSFTGSSDLKLSTRCVWCVRVRVCVDDITVTDR